jgi:predicted transcriptional regulator
MTKTLSQRSWEWIKEQPDFHTTELAAVLEVPRKKVKLVLDEFIRKGHVIAINKSAKPYVYKGVAENEPNFSRDSGNSHSPVNARQKIWQAMRYLNTFTVEEVMAASEQTRSNVTRFISALTQYGYVIKTRKQRVDRTNKRPSTPNRYLLLNNTGRLYPIVRANTLWDQNRKLEHAKQVRKESSKCTG